jgi:pimeloyl-ACP methyl ester carboxylesterase
LSRRESDWNPPDSIAQLNIGAQLSFEERNSLYNIPMIDPSRILYIHGSESSSQTFKATLLRSLFPGLIIPDFTGGLPERMLQLEAALGIKTGWALVGSSLGGLMAALFAMQHPGQVRKLVLLAPALTLPGFTMSLNSKITIPTSIIQGTQDEFIPLEPTRKLAEKVFTDLTYIVVNDDHRLHKTARELDWTKLLA